MRPYPSRNGLPLSPIDVELPGSRLKDKPSNKNNHHPLFPHKRYELGGIIYATPRDLEDMQCVLPKDVHNTGKDTLHSRYGPPEIPKPTTVIDRILEALASGESLQSGTAQNPILVPVSTELVDEILQENLTNVRRQMT